MMTDICPHAMLVEFKFLGKWFEKIAPPSDSGEFSVYTGFPQTLEDRMSRLVGVLVIGFFAVYGMVEFARKHVVLDRRNGWRA
ncbi:MAG: hypothetical protein ACM31D_10360 [Bacteroidota bacterium]